MRWTSVAAMVLLALLAAPARSETLEEQVNRAIERGIASVRTFLGDDGAGKTSRHEEQPVGDTALLLCALVKSGVPSDDPQVRKALAWIRDRPIDKTYSAATYVLALDAFKDTSLDSKIRDAAAWIESTLRPEGRWAYPDKSTDLSNTQYAVLALWVAQRHGFRPRDETWTRVLAAVQASQAPSGGFGYWGGYDETGAMTVGALAILELALQAIPEAKMRSRKAPQAALARGWEYLERNFRTDANPQGPHGGIREWTEYYLYGVERLAAITRRDKIAGRDWYTEGARHLVASQKPDGSWGEPWDTCFALLFLRRATFTGMGGDAKAPATGASAAAARPVQPREEFGWIFRWLVAGPVADPKDELFDAPPPALAKSVPTAGSPAPHGSWSVHTSRHQFVQLDPERQVERSSRWAFTWLHVSGDTDAVLWCGQDDGIRVLLDGTSVLDRHIHDGDERDAHAIPVRLAAGSHRLLLQIENWGGCSGFWMRIAKPDGTECTGVHPSLDADASDLEESALAQPAFFTLDELLRLLPRARTPALTFDTRDDLRRLAIDLNYGDYPEWAERPERVKMEDQHPNPGATGIVGLHPPSPDFAAHAYWRVLVPERSPRFRARVSAVPEQGGRRDGVLRIGVYDGKLAWPFSGQIGPDATPAAGNWRTVDLDLAPWAGREVLIVLEVANGGATDWYGEGIWFDTIEVRTGGG